MSVETQVRLITPNFTVLDNVVRPNDGGTYLRSFNPHEYLVMARLKDRISPTVEPRTTVVFPSSGSISFNDDLKHLDNLSSGFDRIGGQRLAHDPVQDRARYERAKTDTERQAVRQGIIVDATKHLYERAHTSQSDVKYYQDKEGRIYNPDFPGEAFDVVLQRGLEYSKSKGFVDYEREVKEFEGWKKVMKVLFDPQTKLDSKAIVISKAGMKQGTAFTDKFVDIFTKTIDPKTGQIVVVMRRFASGTNDDEYRKAASGFDCNYFKDEESSQGTIDVYYKEHPIFIDSTKDARKDTEIFNAEFKKQNGATEEQKTIGYLDECRLFILHYADTICAKFFEPQKVVTAFNAFINVFDSLRKGLVKSIDDSLKNVLGFVTNTINNVSELTYKTEEFFRMQDYYGNNMKVEQIMIGCGFSGGISVNGIIKGVGGFISKTGGTLLRSLGTGGESSGFVCPKCEYQAKGPVGNTCPGCGLTKEEYARSGGKTC